MNSISTHLTILLVCLAHYSIYGQEKLEVEGAIVIQNSEAPTPAAGTIRWTGTDFEGWNGAAWMSLTTDPGTQTGEIQYWDGSAWVTVTPGQTGQSLTFVNGVPLWIGDPLENVVANPNTGKIWMDRNLGAIQVATSSTDTLAYGHLYQWGRGNDGHEVRTSGTTITPSNSDTPGHGNFITASSSPFDWRSPQNDMLWQDVNGVNNPCPTGYRLPTDAELYAERTSWGSYNASGAFASPLKLPETGFRDRTDGSLKSVGSIGYYWSSTVSGTNSRLLTFSSSNTNMVGSSRAHGLAVRCLKE